MPYTAKLSFSGVLKHFRGKELKSSLMGLKINYIQKKLRMLRKLYIVNKLEKGISCGKFYLDENTFLVKPVKRDKH